MIVKFQKTRSMEIFPSSICTWDRCRKTLTIESPNELKTLSGDDAYSVLAQLEKANVFVKRVGRV